MFKFPPIATPVGAAEFATEEDVAGPDDGDDDEGDEGANGDGNVASQTAPQES